MIEHLTINKWLIIINMNLLIVISIPIGWFTITHDFVLSISHMPLDVSSTNLLLSILVKRLVRFNFDLPKSRDMILIASHCHKGICLLFLLNILLLAWVIATYVAITFDFILNINLTFLDVSSINFMFSSLFRGSIKFNFNLTKPKEYDSYLKQLSHNVVS